MAPRASWKGTITLGQVSCAVALYTAASTSERIAFHMLDRKTGQPVHRQYVDAETGDLVERDDQVKGYEVEDGQHVVLEPDEIAATVPEGDKSLAIQGFLDCAAIETVYFDRPYYLKPADPTAVESFILLREGMARAKVAAVARAVLFRRERSLLIRAQGEALVATTLKFDYEVHPAAEALGKLPKRKIEPEMLELARHIIETKRGRFDPAEFHDRYEAALAELVEAKQKGKKLPRRKAAAKPTKGSDLLDVLRRSAANTSEPPKPKRRKAS